MDWKFIYNHYVHQRRILDGYRWAFEGGLIRTLEPFLEKHILSPGACLVDVGANVGAWTVRAARYYGSVVAIEPFKPTFQTLLRNIRINHLTNVRAFNFALDNQNGEQSFYLRDDQTGGSHSLLKEHMATKAIDAIQVPVRTLDSLNLCPSIIKLDTEGASYRVIEGGIITITAFTPKLCIETHTEEEREIPRLLPCYEWERHYRESPRTGSQAFLVGTALKRGGL